MSPFYLFLQKKAVIFFLSTFCLANFNLCGQRLSDYINTIRGSNNKRGDYSRGNTIPLTTLPQGFTYWTPITDAKDKSWIYQYNHSTIQGFGASHMPSPWINDYASFNIMPEIGPLQVSDKARETTFSHKNEIGKAHYYRVKLDNNIVAEIVPTAHSSMMRFTFPESNDAHLLFDTKNQNTGSIKIDRRINAASGYVYDPNLSWFQTIPNIYFYITCNKPLKSFGYPAGAGVCANVDFNTTANEEVVIKIGTSYISVEQAKANLEAEVGDKSFETLKEESATVWDKLLEKITINGGTTEQKVTFYSCMYRSYAYPTSFWEMVNGTPKYFSPSDGQIHYGKFYTNNGFWDTYKAAWPLYNLLTPNLSGEMLNGFLDFYKTAGVISRWFGPGLNGAMLGSHSDIMFADAYVKGIRNFDYTTAYETMLKHSTTTQGPPLTGRNDNAHAMYDGYTAMDNVDAAASWTLENSICDAAISRMATAMDKNNDATYFANRSLNYINIFSTTVGGFFRGKKIDGSWRTSDANFKPNEWGYENIEGNAWQYRIAPLHDGQGLANLFGSRAALSTAIDDVFNAPREYLTGSYSNVIHEMKEAYNANMGQYVQANQTDHGMIYMYNYAGTPSKTAARAREVMNRLYESGIGTGNGYSGDEDNGSQSAWYVFSALGLFPAGGAVPEYIIGSPLFNKTIIKLENGKTFSVVAPNNSIINKYVQTASLNGLNYEKNFISHSDILNGGVLVLNMGPNPSSWGTGENDVPTSVTKGFLLNQMKDVCLNGIVTASNETGANTATKAFDNNADSKWVVNNNVCWIQYELASSKVVHMYTITSANFEARDPKNWSLKASNDNRSWVTLDTRTNEHFTMHPQLRNFIFSNTTPYKYYRFEIGANSGNSTEVAEIELMGDSPVTISDNSFALKAYDKSKGIQPINLKQKKTKK